MLEVDHRDEFITDTEKIIERYNNLLLKPELSISGIYREIHSLKGTSGLAGLKKMESVSHAFEEFIKSIRDGKSSLTSDRERVFFMVQDYFVKDISSWKSKSVEADPGNLLTLVESYTTSNMPLSIEMIDEDIKSNDFFTEFESTLLKEAMYRGEQFYRVICHIDNDEEMKYPRLFLVVNNLEKISNVIKIYPNMDQIVKNRSKQITLFLTTNLSKANLYKSLSFDRIREVELQRLEYSSFINENETSISNNRESLYGSTIDVEREKIEELFTYYQDLYSKLVHEDILNPEKRESGLELLEGLKSSLVSLTQITAGHAFSFLNGYSQKLAEEFGKKVNFTIEGSEISMDRQLAEVLKEIIIQLVKNSIDHGIESPKIRSENGKETSGQIVLKISMVNDSIALSLSDDGLGVDRSSIVRQAVDDKLIDQNEELSLLSLLSRPGFSTSREINYYSGRGVGLDIVVNSIVNKLDGKVKIENETGKGMTFHILIPPSSAVKKYSLFKYKESTFGFSMVNVVEKLSIDKNMVTIDENSTLNYNFNGEILPIFTPWGRLSSRRDDLVENYGFIIRYLGKRAFFPVDEFVIEKEFLSTDISFIDTATPSHKKLSVAKDIQKFILILPSIING